MEFMLMKPDVMRFTNVPMDTVIQIKNVLMD